MYVVWIVITVLYVTHVIGTPTVIAFILGTMVVDSWDARHKGDA